MSKYRTQFYKGFGFPVNRNRQGGCVIKDMIVPRHVGELRHFVAHLVHFGLSLQSDKTTDKKNISAPFKIAEC